MEGELVRYDTMVTAIAECFRVDEVKELRDKARALEVYARQAQNVEAERKATGVRLRAERRCGELLREQAQTGQRATAGNPQWSHAETIGPKLADLGISKTQSSRWQALAAVPNEQFEKHLCDPVVVPTTSGIIAEAKSVPTGQRMNDTSLWIWGRLRDFERMRCADSDANEIYGWMTDTMQADVRRILPTFIEWCEQLTMEVANA